MVSMSSADRIGWPAWRASHSGALNFCAGRGGLSAEFPLLCIQCEVIAVEVNVGWYLQHVLEAANVANLELQQLGRDCATIIAVR